MSTGTLKMLYKGSFLLSHLKYANFTTLALSWAVMKEFNKDGLEVNEG